MRRYYCFAAKARSPQGKVSEIPLRGEPLPNSNSQQLPVCTQSPLLREINQPLHDNSVFGTASGTLDHKRTAPKLLV